MGALKSIAASVAILVVAIFLGWIIYSFTSSNDEVDKLTGCPKNGKLSPEHWVVVVDVTSPFSLQEKKALEAFHEKIARTVPKKSRIRIYRLSEFGITEGDRVVDICSPGNPSEADPLYESVQAIKSEWEGRFRTTIMRELDRLVDTPGFRQSPIIESLNYISLLEFSQPIGQSKHLVVVSDFIQNSSALNMYVTNPNFDASIKSLGESYFSARFEGVDVQLLYLASGRPKLQADNWVRFWAAYVVSNGGRLVPQEIKPIEKF